MKEQGMFHDETEQHMEDMRNGAVAMLVVVRVRPLTAKEASVDGNEVVKVLDSKMIVMVDATGEEGEKRGRSREAQFSFDFAYGQTATTKDIYDQALSGLLDGVLEGYNSTILAYGATGCGKTYTMIGEQGKEGISALAMIDLLGRANELRRTKNVVIRISYIEIYNENIKDLLVSEDKNLDIREDPKEGVVVPGATEVAISSMLELATVLKVGAANRSKEATASNDASSRSHSLLLVRTESKDKAQGIKEETGVGKLSLVDLAGSERAGGQKGARQIEGAKINKSLLALGNCIQVLAQSSSKSVFVPYRQSKLTRLLKESLGGNCRTALIVNVTPFSGSWQENYNSLVYANRAKSIKNSATRNVLASQAHLSNYVALISNLKRQNDELKKQLRGSKNHSLPQLKSVSAVDGGERMEMHRVQTNIDAHFAQEEKILGVISEITMKLDKAAFKLCRMHLEDKGDKARKSIGKVDKTEKNEGKLNKQIAELSEQRRGFEEKLQELVFERGSLMAEIKTSELSQNSVSLLIAHYREKKVEMELEEVRLRQQRMESQREEKEKLMGALGQQLRIRDKIIEEQRLIIQKNNIINRITYSKMGNLSNNVFPDIFQALGDAQKSLLPQEKNKLTLFRQKSTNKAQAQKISQPKRKKQFFNSNNNQSLFQPTQRDDTSFQKINGVSSESNLLAQQPRSSILAVKKQGKIVRNKSKKPNRQLDFVYMQR